MFKRIRLWLLKQSIIEPNIDDIIYIINNSNFNPYKHNDLVNVVSKDIHAYIAVFKTILSSDLMDKYINLPMVRYNEEITIREFFTNNGYFIDNYKAILSEWLSLYKEVLEIHEVARNGVGLGKLTSNSYKIEPYINSSRTIIETIYNIVIYKYNH